MTVTDFLLPVFVQVALTFALLIRTAIGRVSSFRSGEVKPEDIALGEQGWPLPGGPYRVTDLAQFLAACGRHLDHELPLLSDPDFLA